LNKELNYKLVDIGEMCHLSLGPSFKWDEWLFGGFSVGGWKENFFSDFFF
jgi:hypothetical protein